MSLRATGEGAITVGRRCTVAADAEVVFARPGKVTIGDYCTIGPGVKVVCDGGDVTLGDWTTVHDRSLILSAAGVTIGQHAWFGQQSVIDGTGGLAIGHGVRVGMYSQIWSHVAAGEQIEGCTLYGARPVVIEDDVWLVGSCIVASGVTLGRRTVALIASNITKSWPAGSVLAGSPAAPKPGLTFYRALSVDERWLMLSSWVREIASNLGIECTQTECSVVLREARGDQLHFFRGRAEAAAAAVTNPEATICCLETKRYTKRLTSLEQRVLKALASNRARFLAEVGNFE